jgi:hypothetical protein
LPASAQLRFLFSIAAFGVSLPSMAGIYRCLQCEKEEARCDCDKYCGFCEGYSDVRLCADGIYYCKDCRDSCNYKAEDEN